LAYCIGTSFIRIYKELKVNKCFCRGKEENMKSKTLAIVTTLILASIIALPIQMANADTAYTWPIAANLGDSNVFNDINAVVTKTDKPLSVEFKVEILDDAPHYGMGIAISTAINTIGFQVYYAEFNPPASQDWYYLPYAPAPWGGTPVTLASSGTGITATGSASGKIFTVEIPISLLGGAGATFYFAIQFRTLLLGTYPEGLNLWAQTDATNFASETLPQLEQVIPEVPIGAVVAGASMLAAFGAYMGLRRRKPMIAF
jgi:hypothetical protein